MKKKSYQEKKLKKKFKMTINNLRDMLDQRKLLKEQRKKKKFEDCNENDKRKSKKKEKLKVKLMSRSLRMSKKKLMSSITSFSKNITHTLYLMTTKRSFQSFMTCLKDL